MSLPRGREARRGEELTPDEEFGADRAIVDGGRRERPGEASMPHGHLPSLGKHQYGTLP